MRRIYEPTAYGPLPDQGNYWRTTISAPDQPALLGEVQADFAIVGGGYTGLMAALTLAEAGADVVLLEAEQPGWGASGRNGGFCCLGGTALDGKTLIRRHGPQEARRFFQTEAAAVDLVAETLERFGIQADTHSKGETQLAHRPRDWADLQAYADVVRDQFGVTAQLTPKDKLATEGMSGPKFHGALTIPLGFALNPLKYATGLAGAAQAAGTRLYGNSPVTRLGAENGRHLLKTPQGQVSARTVLFATNGYSSDDLPKAFSGRYLPVQSSILVTRPLTENEIAAQGWHTDQMCYDSRNLLHYFRLMPNRRFLFGMRGAIRSTPDSLHALQGQIRRDFEAMFPAWAQVETPHFWSGLACLSARLTPFAGPIPGMENAFAAMAYHGNGVAMGSFAGQQMARLALGQSVDMPAFMQAPMQQFPLGRWRRILLAPAYAWYGWADRV